MDLDKRIKDDKRPLDCLDIAIAKTYIGQKGYFANCIQAFQDLGSTDYQLVYATLKEIDSQRVIAFTDDFDGESSYFLPDEWVKEPEKKYRAFTSEEFLNLFDTGKLHSIRQSDVKGRFIITDIYFSDECGKDEVYVCFDCDCCGYEMEYLLENNFEYLDGTEWKPFGMGVEE